MPERYIDLENKEYQNIEDQIDSSATKMELSENNTYRNSGYGICNHCRHFSITKTEFRTVKALCSKYIETHLFILKSNEPITECSDFHDNFRMSLYDMQKIAYIIDVKRQAIGFIETELIEKGEEKKHDTVPNSKY